MRFPRSIAPGALVAALFLTCAANADAAALLRKGMGTYPRAALKGPAKGAIKSFLTRTVVPCTTATPAGPKQGDCQLNAITDLLEIHYLDVPGKGPEAVALVTFEDDTGSATSQFVALWKKGSPWTLVGRAEAPGITESAARIEHGVIVVSGIVKGPDDAECCPATPAKYEIVQGDGIVLRRPGKR